MREQSATRWRLLTPPAGEPLSVTQAKSFLRIENDTEDDTLARAITAAREAAEQYLRVLLLPQSWELVVALPCPAVLHLPAGPATAVTQVRSTAQDATATTVDSSYYRLAVDRYHVYFSQIPDGISLSVQYDAGSYATAAQVPASIIQGMLHHITAMLDTRDGSAAIPPAARNSYEPYRRIGL